MCRKVSRYPNNIKLRHAFSNARKNYNRLRKYLTSKYCNKIAEEINSKTSNKSQSFWNKIKENKIERYTFENFNLEPHPLEWNINSPKMKLKKYNEFKK